MGNDRGRKEGGEKKEGYYRERGEWDVVPNNLTDAPEIPNPEKYPELECNVDRPGSWCSPVVRHKNMAHSRTFHRVGLSSSS